MLKHEGEMVGGHMTFYSVYNQDIQITGYIQILRKMMLTMNVLKHRLR